MSSYAFGSEPSTHDYPSRRPVPLGPSPPGHETAGQSPVTRPELGHPHDPPPALGDYDLLHRAGEGGMSIVYQARHRPTGRLVALKMLKPQVAIRDDLLARFRREVRIADALRHPNIAAVLDAGEADGRFFYTMPFAPTNLASQRRRFFDARAAARLMATVARAVHHAHAHGVLHRDLKPGNILLQWQAEPTDAEADSGSGPDATGFSPLVSDFGLARWVETSQQLTATDEVIGTPGYMAPEQVDGPSGALTPAADVWALGIILYELLTGQRPFDTDGTRAVLLLILTTDPLAPRQFRPDLDPNLEAVVLRCLRKAPSERYATAAALADDLERWLDGRPVRAQVVPAARAPRTGTRLWRCAAACALLVAVPTILVLGGLDPRPGAAPPATAAEAGINWYSPLHSARKLQAITDMLSEGRPVEMALDRGGLRYHHNVLGEKSLKVEPLAKQPGVQVTAADPGLLALLPAPPARGYRIEAELLHHDHVDPNSHVGVFFGYKVVDQHLVAAVVPGPGAAVAAGGGARHVYCHWVFNDLSDRNDPNRKPLPPGRVLASLDDRLVLRLNMRPPAGRRGGAVDLWLNDKLTQADQTAPAEPKPGQEVWRRLAVEVRPQSVTVYLDGRRVGQLATAVLDQRLKRWQELYKLTLDAPLRFVPDGAAGLCVRGSTVRCRSFLVTPLPE